MSACCLRAFLDDELTQQGFLLLLRERREVLPARERCDNLLDGHIRRHLGDHRVDLIVRLRRLSARNLASLGRRSEFKLKLLRIAQRYVGHGITGRSEFVPHQADDGECVTVRPQRDLLAEDEAGGTVDDHFVVAAHDLTASQKLARTAGPSQFKAYQEETEWRTFQFRLDRLVGDRARPFHAVDPAYQFPGIALDARRLGEWPVGAGLHNPQIRVCRTGLPQRIVDHATVYAGDHDHDSEQQAQSKVGQDKAQEIVLDISVRQIHRLGSSVILTARPMRSPLRNWATTLVLSGRPPVIS